MKILICHNFYRNRGGEDSNFFLQKKLLQSKDHKVSCFTRNSQAFKKYSLIQKVMLFFNAVFSWRTYTKVVELIKKERPDVIHVHNTYPLLSPAIYYAAHAMRVPIVQTLHNYRTVCVNGLFLRNKGEICERCGKGNFLPAVFGRCYRGSYIQSFAAALLLFLNKILRTFQKIDFFISPSVFLTKKMKEMGFKGDIICVPNFIEKREIDISTREADDKTLCYVGRLSREKGLFTLLKAVKGLDVQLKIIGGGPVLQELKDIVSNEQMNNVMFVGHKRGDDLMREIARSTATVVSSEWYEVFGLTIIEAFSLCKPVIGARIGAIPELVRDGETGLTFIPGDADDLRDKIKRLFADMNSLRRMGQNARKMVEENFNSEKHYHELMKVYQKAIEKYR